MTDERAEALVALVVRLLRSGECGIWDACLAAARTRHLPGTRDSEIERTAQLVLSEWRLRNG